MKRFLPIVTIIFISIIFVLPQLITGKMIVGADSIFHYNRFFDAAEQIKNSNFQYFISLYGFQQSGRIVNAVYGPFFAYFQGLIVLISGSWFHYQILSNLILYLISGFSMLFLLRHVKVSYWISVPVAILFMSTYSIQYWIINQGFTSWGASFYPVCMVPMVNLIIHKKFSVVNVALAIALMTQIHLLSTFMLILMYVPFYGYYFLKQTDKGQTIWKLIQSILVYLVLTANIWIGMFDLYKGNRILSPFVNQNMSQKSINLDGSYWLIYPQIFPLFLLLGFFLCFSFRRKNTILSKVVLGTSLSFLFLSTSLVPWTALIKKNIPFISLIQFPFRFFVPFTLLFLLYLGLLLNEWSRKKWIRFMGVISIFLLVTQTLCSLCYHLEKWENETFVSRHTYLKCTPDEARKTFFLQDKSISLKIIQKTTPDYLPIYESTTYNKYDRYKEEILNRESQFVKAIHGNFLIIRWKSNGEEKVHLPVIIYNQTLLKQEGQILTDYGLTDIGSPIVKQQPGSNEIILTYKPEKFVHFFIFVAIISWLISGYFFVASYRKNKYKRLINETI